MTEIPAAGYFSEAARTNGEAKQAQDDVLAVLREMERAALAFAPHPSDPLAMTVEVKAGYLFVDGALAEVAAQTAGAFSAPAADPRIDRIVIDAVTGAVSVVQGTEAAAPVAPAIPNGKLPVARVALTVAMTEITGADITDERARAADSDPLTPTPSELTIAAGSVTPTAHYHTVDTESDAAADDLDTIATTNLPEGALLFLAAEDVARVVTVRGAADNITLAGPDMALDSLAKRLLLQRRGTGWDEVARSHPTAPLLHVRDEKSDGTDAGGSSAATTSVRTLNTVVTNEIAGASLSSDQVTLPPGTYDADATAPGFFVGKHKMWIYDTTGATVLVLGGSAFSNVSGIQTVSLASGRFVLTVESTLEVRHYTEKEKTINGLGIAAASGQAEVYTELRVRRVA